jgi:hypothetical protein
MLLRGGGETQSRDRSWEEVPRNIAVSEIRIVYAAVTRNNQIYQENILLSGIGSASLLLFILGIPVIVISFGGDGQQVLDALVHGVLASLHVLVACILERNDVEQASTV